MCPENKETYIKGKFIFKKNIMKVVDCMILKQAIRDLASKDTNLSESASDFFKSSKYKELCLSLEIDKSMMDKSIKELETYPLISKKKLANRMAIMLDGFSRE